MSAPFYQRNYRIDEDHEVGPATDSVDRVFCVRPSLVKVSACGRGQVSARGKAQDADTVGIDVPFLSTTADDTYCPLGVL